MDEGVNLAFLDGRNRARSAANTDDRCGIFRLATLDERILQEQRRR